MSGYAMPLIGDVIAGKYRLERVAGEGGMGIVYAAEHLVLKQRVAVKVLLPSAAASEAVVERFEREARAGAKIDSQHVARVMDAGSLKSGAPFLVMEFLEGCDLEELLELQGTLPVQDAVDYLLQTCEALAHAHAVGVVHRDLKPANLFLASRPDGGNAIKVLDFGISKTMRAKPEDKRLTGEHVLGSPVYMSPEQLRNAKEIDPRADLWSLGIVGYELLSGTAPFDGSGVGEIFAAILEKEPEALEKRNPAVPPELSSILLMCLRREPAERWPDAAALASALAPFGTGAYTAVVERSEQVLARAKLLQVRQTPLETRLVVEAIEAAAQRARGTSGGLGYDTSAALPLLKVKADAVDDTVIDGFRTRVSAMARRSSPRTVGIVAGLLALVVVVAIVVLRSSGASARADAQSTDVATAASFSRPTGSAEGESDTEEEVLELPDTPNGGPPIRRIRPASKPSSRPQRPKFLNSRE